MTERFPSKNHLQVVVGIDLLSFGFQNFKRYQTVVNLRRFQHFKIMFCFLKLCENGILRENLKKKRTRSLQIALYELKDHSMHSKNKISYIFLIECNVVIMT